MKKTFVCKCRSKRQLDQTPDNRNYPDGMSQLPFDRSASIPARKKTSKGGRGFMGKRRKVKYRGEITRGASTISATNLLFLIRNTGLNNSSRTIVIDKSSKKEKKRCDRRKRLSFRSSPPPFENQITSCPLCRFGISWRVVNLIGSHVPSLIDRLFGGF